jgi:hypothetical protein
MAEQKENPNSCKRCGSEKQPINVFNPNTPGHPTKRVALCATCAANDDKVTFVSGPGIECVPDHAVPSQATENVPGIDPAVPDEDNVVETKEFGPKLQDLNVESPVKINTPVSEATPEPPKDLGPVPPDVLKQKLATQEKDHDTLVGKRQQLQEQLTQINNVIMVKRGAIAQLRDLLGNAKS